jgi:hypothetical protein
VLVKRKPVNKSSWESCLHGHKSFFTEPRQILAAGEARGSNSSSTIDASCSGGFPVSRILPPREALLLLLLCALSSTLQLKRPFVDDRVQVQVQKQASLTFSPTNENERSKASYVFQVNNVRSETSHLRFGATVRVIAAAIAACSAATAHQSKLCQELLSHNPSVAKRTVIGSFSVQQHQQKKHKCVELGQPRDGIDRNGRLEHE